MTEVAIWELGDDPFGAVPLCWADRRHGRYELCSVCGGWRFERAKRTPGDHRPCTDQHRHTEHMWAASEHPGWWRYCAGLATCLPLDGVDQWIVDQAYAPDDFVFGDAGLTDRQLPDLHRLLDLVRPGWRGLFTRRSRAVHARTPHGHPCCGACPIGSQPVAVDRCGGVDRCAGCREAAVAIHLRVEVGGD